ncbi:hypothetical protein ACH5RR_015608 [Cinchona calisaya]|uniref:Retrotransposon gag domain-containing protein n=1 Tax=Cinchona calisaya TaxID=153742 RepID=A0ABD2ZTN1_9GENT
MAHDIPTGVGNTLPERMTRQEQALSQLLDRLGDLPVGYVLMNDSREIKAISAVLREHMQMVDASLDSLSHDLAVTKKAAKVNGIDVLAMIDTGATHSFVIGREVRRLKLELKKHKYRIKAVNAEAQPVLGVASVELTLGQWCGKCNLTANPIPHLNGVMIADERCPSFIPSIFVKTNGSVDPSFSSDKGKRGSHILAIQLENGLTEFKADVFQELPDCCVAGLDEFADIMPAGLPKMLPPQRAENHHIGLVPGAIPSVEAPCCMELSQVCSKCLARRHYGGTSSDVTHEEIPQTKKDRKGREPSRDVLTAAIARVEKLELAMAETRDAVEDAVVRIDEVESRDEDLRGEMQGALNAAADGLAQRSESLEAELVSIKDEIAAIRTEQDQVATIGTAITTWDQFVDEFRSYFYPQYAERDARAKLRRQEMKGEVREYVKEFSQLMLQIQSMSEEDAFFQFMDGLKPWTRLELERRNVDSLSKAMTVAESLVEFKPREKSTPPKERSNFSKPKGKKIVKESNNEFGGGAREKSPSKNEGKSFTAKDKGK